MHKVIFFWSFISLAIFHLNAFSCTTVQLPDSREGVVGKNYDWDDDHGLVMVNPRGLSKVALDLNEEDNPASWTSRYASITFNQVARDLPLGGINEAGLVVEIMMVDTQDPPADSRQTINELQWIQYQLDNFGTVAEVSSHIDEIRISRVQAPVHYLLCDTKKACAVLEFKSGERKYYAGASLPVPTLTNHHYDDSLKILASFKGYGGTRPEPKSLRSEDRFVRSSMRAKQFKEGQQTAEEVAFGILDAARQHDYTKFQIVYSPKSLSVQFRSLKEKTIKTLKFADFTDNLDCHAEMKMLDVNAKSVSEVIDYSDLENERIVTATVKSQGFPAKFKKKMVDYPSTLKCR